MRASLSLLALLAALVIALGVVPAFAADRALRDAPIIFTETQKADLKRVSGVLNAITTLQGRFMQIAADGNSVEGNFYIQKPGKMRFAYDPPSPLTVIADGRTIAVDNKKLGTTDRYPLYNSPLRMLLSNDVDLARDSQISAVKREKGYLFVTAREKRGPAQGAITLAFTDPGLELRQWEVVDAQGAKTLVIVSNLRRGGALSPKLFVAEDRNPFKNKDY